MKKRIALLLLMTLLSGCVSTAQPEDSSSLSESESSSSQAESELSSLPESSSQPEETNPNPEKVISPYSLSELGYRLEIPKDIGIYDSNQSRDNTGLVHSYFEPPLYYVQEEETSFQYGTCFFASYGGDNLVGGYTAFHPQCMYAAANADTMVCLSLLQAFLRSDVEKEDARIAFLRTEKTASGAVRYVPYTLSPEETNTYQVYEDEEIVVYDFLGLTSAPPLDKQLEEGAQGDFLEQKGIDLSWISDMRDYFIETDGGIGRFLTKS